jgi:CitMHS family citrate-Mg2+:H+ or citrate-Ca2+:H+ symporter
MPLSLIFDPDSYYFGVMPVIANAAAQFGVDPVMVGRASILGQMTTGFPVSPLTAATFLLTGLTGVDLGEHQKNTIPWAFAATMVMLVVALVMGVVAI